MQNRLLTLDLYRALAVVLMVLFHFTYDLHLFGFIETDTTQVPFWVHLRTFIVTLFMSAVGMSLYLVYANRYDRHKHMRRLGLLAVASAVISIGTYIIFPNSWIYFGVLHMIFVASLIGPIFTRIPNISGALGVFIITIYSTELLTMQKLLEPLRLPLDLLPHHTEDLAPFIPWFGVVLMGIFIMHQGWLQKIILPKTKVTESITWLGQHSLAIYLIHQPLLFAILLPLSYITASG